MLLLPVFLVILGLGLVRALGTQVLGRYGPILMEVVARIDFLFREIVIEFIANERLRDILDAEILIFEGLGTVCDLDHLFDVRGPMGLGTEVGLDFLIQPDLGVEFGLDPFFRLGFGIEFGVDLFVRLDVGVDLRIKVCRDTGHLIGDRVFAPVFRLEGRRLFRYGIRRLDRNRRRLLRFE